MKHINYLIKQAIDPFMVGRQAYNTSKRLSGIGAKAVAPMNIATQKLESRVHELLGAHNEIQSTQKLFPHWMQVQEALAVQRVPLKAEGDKINTQAHNLGNITKGIMREHDFNTA